MAEVSRFGVPIAKLGCIKLALIRIRKLKDPMRFKLISCEVFFREICLSMARTPHLIDVDFTDKGAHDRSDFLRQLLQEKIDQVETSGRTYDAILLGFGLCGNATLHLQARTIPLVIPRAHDCCTLFLGSRQRFQHYFKENPSMPFSSAGYMERGDTYVHEDGYQRLVGADHSFADMVEKYGEENARYIWETLHPPSASYDGHKLVYIEVPETAHLGYAELCKQKAEADGKAFVLLTGDVRLLDMMVRGDWPESEFLVVQPGQQIKAVYDWEQILRAE